MPSLISYSPISISSVPVTSAQNTITLIRRDLFDARFQLISQGDEDGVGLVNTHNADAPLAFNKRALDFLDAPSDLVPGVYEGGLKTWECSLDLVEYLRELQCSSNFGGFSGKRVLEVSFFCASQLIFGDQQTARSDVELPCHLYTFYSNYFPHHIRIQIKSDLQRRFIYKTTMHQFYSL